MANKVKGNSSRPRLYIFKSNKHIYAQIIDDQRHKILCSCSSTSKNIKLNSKSNVNCRVAYMVGQSIAYKTLKMGISKVLFDRGKCIYHGQVQSLAEGVRQEGIKF